MGQKLQGPVTELKLCGLAPEILYRNTLYPQRAGLFDQWWY